MVDECSFTECLHATCPPQPLLTLAPLPLVDECSFTECLHATCPPQPLLTLVPLPLVPLSRYECAVTLVQLSSAPTAVRAAANCFCQLLVSHSDNNVKLIVLDRLQVRGGCVLVHSSIEWLAVPARI